MNDEPTLLGLGWPSPDFKDGSPIGLADNAGIRFECGTCEYIRNGVCTNPDPRLKNRNVEQHWCCNLYDHAGMRVIV